MVHRKPDITAASMTNMKPQNSNAVSFATVTENELLHVYMCIYVLIINKCNYY